MHIVRSLQIRTLCADTHNYHKRYNRSFMLGIWQWRWQFFRCRVSDAIPCHSRCRSHQRFIQEYSGRSVQAPATCPFSQT
uniref:Uncharacterized protein n=1 Tax=Arundo donax TaxID=35708 RepID=A0A0A9EW92_ARUDO